MTAFAARLLFFLLVLLPPCVPAAAQLAAPGRNAIAASLVAETDAPRAGEAISLALVMKPEPGWHGYWKNPGDAGVEPRIEWRLPAGISAGAPLYPVPQRLMIAGLMNYVYEGDYALLIPLTVAPDLAPGTNVRLRGTAHYLACTDKICVPEKSEIALDLVVGNGRTSTRTEQFDLYRQALPRPLGSPARMEQTGDSFRLAIPLPAALSVSDPYVFPLTDQAIDYSAPQRFSRSGDMLIVEAKAAGKLPASLDGVLKFGAADGLSFTARPGSVPPAGTPLAGTENESDDDMVAIAAALAGAILGGLLLNIMPCVFPILSLKALSLAKAGGGETAARREALAYTAGVVLTCLALGGGLLALRSGGAAIGWAFQLQDPRVILLLLLLVTLIALNLAGLFELPALGRGDRLANVGGTSGAFWTGALAAFVATPCTGPFMGAALGAALILPSLAALAIFAGLGLGLALPFLLLGFVPALRRRLPKPGAWMVRFRHILSLPMFATAIALAWILERQSGTEGLVLGIAVVLAIGVAAWWAGKRHGLLPLVPGLLAAAASLMWVPTARVPAAPAEAGPLAATPFSEDKLKSLRAAQRPVFVYFTADWCVTCKVNEKAVLARDEVAKSFADKKVAVLVGDWTRGDAAIGRFLERHGRSGVPFYLYYAPGKSAEILPQILTVAKLTGLPT
ncbi:protein-disulfide reductase DsbD family protein [Sphingosinicella rhizophila]|uniref:Protein-disulfide reductase DsbD family protein n=1 Tax=Sphingosinicella rhizophila TaxID=3050082 RepID=A0ABU3Q3H4_9SPHN|nr:protein-disulfide reductase DsbD domain-containing protein [Sphingosinicella sp. GR2756]MDT9597961.1 protein-disulfide reductase DsbD family protein [Sphingosinicella sp. GR2756]